MPFAQLTAVMTLSMKNMYKNNTPALATLYEELSDVVGRVKVTPYGHCKR